MVRVPTLLAVMIALPLTPGCAHSRSPSTTSASTRPDLPVAVLPVVWATRRAGAPLDAARVVARALGRDARVRALPLDPTARALRAEPAGCVTDVSCVQRVGTHLRASAVVLVELAELGGTVLVRASVVDVRLGTRSATRQEVVHDARLDRLSAALDRVGREVARPLAPSRAEPPRTRHFWQQGLFWVAAGVVVAGAATAVTVSATSGSSEPRPDVVITPP